MIEHLFSTLVEVLFVNTGRRVLRLFGAKEPGEVAAFLTGLGAWVLAGLVIVALVQ